MKLILSFLCVLPAIAQDKVVSPGEAKFRMNCSACHVLANVVVGPSLVTLAKSYPEEKRADFIKWARVPGKKNPNMIQMPSMAHVPDGDLTEIHDYILSATKGIKNKSGKALYPKFKEPKRDLPYVVRASMPDSSPASVAVVLENGLSVCWDTEACRMRYIYVGDKTNLFSMWKPASLQNKPFYTESSMILPKNDARPRFLGYRLVEKDPVFLYRLGPLEVSERISAGSEEGSVSRTFSVPNTNGFTLDLAHEGNVIITSDKGILKNHKLTLLPDEAKSFTLTITKK